MKTETDILIKISELELWITRLEKEYPIEEKDSIVIANEQIEILKWMLEN